MDRCQRFSREAKNRRRDSAALAAKPHSHGMDKASPRFRPYAIWTRRGKPFLVWIAPWLLVPYGLGGILFTLLITFESLRAPMGPGGATPAGQYVAIVTGFVYSAAIILGGYGLYRERLWARWLLTGGLLPILVLGAATLVALTTAPSPADRRRRCRECERTSL